MNVRKFLDKESTVRPFQRTGEMEEGAIQCSREGRVRNNG